MIGDRRICIRIPENLYNELTDKSKKMNKTESRIVRDALNIYLYGSPVTED